MDEEPGKIIDGTARARQWRRSQLESSADAAARQGHCEAPKSIAASLLVPPALDDELVPPFGEGSANRRITASSAPSDGTRPAAGDVNLFLSPEAAVAAPRRSRSAQISAVAVGLARRASARLRRISGIGGLRPRFSFSRTRVAGVLGLAGACALVAAVIVASQPNSSPRARLVGGGSSAVGFDRLKEELLSSTASAFAAVPEPARPHASIARTAARRSAPGVRHVRRGATRIVPAPSTSRAERASQSTSAIARASAVTTTASAPSTTPANEAPTQQSPRQQTTQQQQVNYQPPSQLAGPLGLGSQVGGNCAPKCS